MVNSGTNRTSIASDRAWNDVYVLTDDNKQNSGHNTPHGFLHVDQISTKRPGEKARVSLSSDELSQKQPRNASSDDDDESWMDDLPSPSTLIGREPDRLSLSENDSRLRGIQLDYGINDYHDAMENASTEMGVGEKATAKSVQGELGDQVRDRDTAKSPQGEDIVETPFTSDDKLFFSTGSIDEQFQDLQEGFSEQAIPSFFEDQACEHERPHKKLRTEDGNDDALGKVVEAHHDGVASTPTRFPRRDDNMLTTSAAALPPTFHRPAWVESFDPAFIAEWQDIVEFVD